MSANAQTKISGELVDNKTKKPLTAVHVRNVHSKIAVQSDSLGRFELIVKSGELIDIDQDGYNRVRIRVANEKQPLFYKLHLDKTVPRLDVNGHLLPYQIDSLEYNDTYGLILNGAKKGENNATGGGFSLDALSKQNRDRWAFQAMYEKWQREKYIDFAFNKDLIERITYLKGEELRQFMEFYRPSYTFLRSASEYEYLDYIKKSFTQFQHRQKY